MRRFDHNLTQAWTPERQDELPPLPYVMQFRQGGKTLTYLAAAHKDPETIAQLVQCITEHRPDALVLEQPGRLNHENYFSSTLTPLMAAESMSEPERAAFLATQHGIPFFCAEPEDRIIHDTLCREGYTSEDYMGLYALRNIAHWIKEERDITEAVNAYFAEDPRGCFGFIPAEERLNAASFGRWFDRHNTTGISLRALTSDDWAPSANPDANYFQRLSAHIGAVREPEINKTIEAALGGYDHVMVVYGGSHLPMSKSVYEAALGEGKILKTSELAQRRPMATPAYGIAEENGVLKGAGGHPLESGSYELPDGRTVIVRAEWLKAGASERKPDAQAFPGGSAQKKPEGKPR